MPAQSATGQNPSAWQFACLLPSRCYESKSSRWTRSPVRIFRAPRFDGAYSYTLEKPVSNAARIIGGLSGAFLQMRALGSSGQCVKLPFSAEAAFVCEQTGATDSHDMVNGLPPCASRASAAPVQGRTMGSCVSKEPCRPPRECGEQGIRVAMQPWVAEGA